MHRLIVALLTAVDAAIAVAVGIAATLAPLTLVWVFGLGGAADWAALWPVAVTVWQFGNLVPLAVTLPADYLAAAGIDPAAASFTLSLAPLAFAAFTAIFAARSGVRASRADAWVTGVTCGTAVFGVLAAIAAFTGQNLIADTELWQAILVPVLVFALPATGAAIVTEWREAGGGFVARVRDRVEQAPHGWGDVPGLVARGTAVVVVGLIGLGAVVSAVGLALRGSEVVALFQAGNVDALGATVLTLAQLVYVPTLAIWGMAFAAGPGFTVGEGTAVSAAGTQVGVVPGIPLLGAIPESTTPWLLLLALVPVALGALAGWTARSRLVHPSSAAAAPVTRPSPPLAPESLDLDRTTALTGLLASAPVIKPEPAPEGPPTALGEGHDDDPIGPRLVVALGIAVLSAAGAALLAAVASGSLGPGRLAHFGPEPGPVALAVGLEVIVGAAILLLSPRGRGRTEHPRSAPDREPAPGARGDDEVSADLPSETTDAAPDLTETLDLGPRRTDPGTP
ncbi:DUF6350 family protein [Microbacterium sp. CFBP9034]|uniref:cell division protein PerM n=1 Tax=Microbacterium sp. CFBP9034 TaxID=3096540 RepID=UPI002A699841|nr:DUF6350 family protein [Microbacterium sp. CFBP9034]MDY0910529.1 DUF6350 family protein [Microbacterium sp. CFBP9034]